MFNNVVCISIFIRFSLPNFLCIHAIQLFMKKTVVLRTYALDLKKKEKEKKRKKKEKKRKKKKKRETKTNFFWKKNKEREKKKCCECV